MTRICCVLIFLFANAVVSRAGDDYSILSLPKELMKNANCVKRMESITYELRNPGEAVMVKRYAITVLNENGDRQAAFNESYDQFHEIRDIEGALFDMFGKQIKKVKGKEIMDLTGNDGSSLIDDNRQKFFSFYHRVYPYTVEYSFEYRMDGVFYIPTWAPREAEGMAVQESRMTMIFPKDYSIRYRSFNYTGNPVNAVLEDKQTLSWEVKNLGAFQSEYAAPTWYEFNPVVFFGPTDFEIEKYKGRMSDWREFGKFIYQLNEGRDVLPDNVKQEVHKLVDGVSDIKQKIAILYNYLQHNTRYISIQLGIGGWRPLDAKFVASKAYGDCKALSNYMYSLLKEAGISSKYTLINAGANAFQVIEDFTSAQFNHVILCVPLQKDSVWLECTSKTLQPGYLSGFTSDRYGLMIDQTGGQLVRTPKYGMLQNIEDRKVDALLSSDGTLKVKSRTRYGGIQQDELQSIINALSKDKVKEYLQAQLDFATYDISSFDYKEDRSSLPAIEEALDISVSNYATITGRRIFIVPNVMTRSYRKLNADSTRKLDIVFRVEYQDIDTVQIELPAGYKPESLPTDISIKNKYGEYHCTVVLKDNKLVYYRNRTQFSGRYLPTEYAAIAKFYDDIYKADRNKVVLVKSETELKAF
jgi:hypothetical protein